MHIPIHFQMKYIALLALVGVTLVCGLPVNEQSREDSRDFDAFVEQFEKEYENEEERLLRFNWFQKNKADIVRHNARFDAGLETHQKAINQFADYVSL